MFQRQQFVGSMVLFGGNQTILKLLKFKYMKIYS